MTKEWAPSTLGRKLTGSTDWRLRLQGLELSLMLNGETHRVNVEEEASYRVSTGFLWTDVTVHLGQARQVKADGLPNAQGAELTQALEAALADKHMREDVAFVQGAHQSVREWLRQKAQQERAAETDRHWLTHEMQSDLEAARARIDVKAVRARMQKPGVQAKLGPEAGAVERSLTQWGADHRAHWTSLNADHTQRELRACKDLFDRVESKSLAARITDEDLYRNPGVPRMLLEADEQIRLQLGQTPLGIDELVALNRIGLTVEHILPQEPSFDVTAYGFLDNDEYLHYRHRLGDLILLEGPLNSACNNRTVEDKMSASNLYLASNLSSVKAVAAEHAGQAGFNKADLTKRGQALAPLIGARWSLN